MAKLKKQILGSVSGALGNFIFKEVKGKNVVSVRTSNYAVPSDTASIDRRRRFALSSKTAIALAANRHLRPLWKPAVPGNMFIHNFIMKRIYKNVQPLTLSDNLSITPGLGFSVSITGAGFSGNQLRVSTGALEDSDSFLLKGETGILLSGIILLSDPVDDTVAANSVINISSEIQSIDTRSPLTFTAAISGGFLVILDKYRVRKVYYTIITTDSEQQPVQYSNTHFV